MTAIGLPLIHSLGWTLLHFCWQGAIVAILLACALGLLPSRASQLRYTVACAAAAWMVMLPAITFCMLAANTLSNPHQAAGAVADAGFSYAFYNSFGQPLERWIIPFEKALNQSLPIVTSCWFAGVLVLLCRLTLGLTATRKMKSLAQESVSAEIGQVFETLCRRLGMERVIELLDSTHVQAPAVIGYLKPAILLPLGCMTGLSTLQIEAILAHELAHIRRHDYLINLFQSLMETVLFYHPAVWWVSNQIRREREHCCDDLAVAVCGDRLAYAKALSFLEERRSVIPTGAFGATGGVLKMRIARLLGWNQSPILSRTAATMLLVLAATTAGFAVWGSARAQSMPSQTNSQNGISSANAPVQVRSLKISSDDLPESDRVEVIQAFQGSTYPLDELMERIRQNLRDRGYVKVFVDLLQPATLPAGQPSRSVDVSVRVSAGAKYTLDHIQVQGNHALSLQEITQLFPLHPGDLFNATAISKGLDRVRKLYESKGYTSFGAIPRVEMDDAHHTITLILNIQEGKAGTS